jgi:chromate transporter
MRRPPDREVRPAGAPASDGDTAVSQATPFRVFRVFLRTGATTYGGMWAASEKLEKDLVKREKWLDKDQLRTSLVLATLIPAPRFLALAGLIGFRVGGWRGSVSAAVGLVLPASLLVLGGVLLIRPEVLAGPLSPLTRSIAVVVVGILFGNACRQLQGSKPSRRTRSRGLALTLGLFASIVAGAPLIVAAVIGFVLGALLIHDSGSDG